LNDSAGGGPVQKTYHLTVTGGTQILMPTLKKMIKGIMYGDSPPYPRMEAQRLTAIDVVYSPSWSSNLNMPPLNLGLALSNTTFNSLEKVSHTSIVGEIPVTKSGGQYRFSATITNWPGPSNTLSNIPITVLDRKTSLIKSPPSTVQLPADISAANYAMLSFTVFAEGGAPSNSADTSLSGRSVPYYDYTWEVTPVPGTNSPALGTSSGTVSTILSNPQTFNILFTDASSLPVTGTYDIEIKARDYLTRANLTDPNYEFIPVTVRIKVIAPAGATLERETGRPTKLKQEQVR
jgi:hypothetical protein